MQLLIVPILQFNLKRAGFETERFVINSTAGIGGVMNVSKKVPWLADVPKDDADSTLAKWGVPAGCYIVWPILGPKSLRDTVGFVGDFALDPVTWVTYGAIGGIVGAATPAVTTPDTVRNVSEKLDTYENSHSQLHQPLSGNPQRLHPEQEKS
ncbi:MAG: MlaA family lipoprotein [Chthoniobacterales bacterium]